MQVRAASPSRTQRELVVVFQRSFGTRTCQREILSFVAASAAHTQRMRVRGVARDLLEQVLALRLPVAGVFVKVIQSL